mgnify:CR=1 FL=1
MDAGEVAGTSQEQGKRGEASGNRVLPAEDGPCGRPEITEDFLDKNPYSRSGIALKKVKGVVIHYVANPGSTAKENRIILIISKIHILRRQAAIILSA